MFTMLSQRIHKEGLHSPLSRLVTIQQQGTFLIWSRRTPLHNLISVVLLPHMAILRYKGWHKHLGKALGQVKIEIKRSI